jgi:serine/threonine protein kinase
MFLHTCGLYLQVLRWCVELARALCFLHNCSPIIIHRDLKPANLLLNGDGHIKVRARACCHSRTFKSSSCIVAHLTVRVLDSLQPQPLLSQVYTSMAHTHSPRNARSQRVAKTSPTSLYAQRTYMHTRPLTPHADAPLRNTLLHVQSATHKHRHAF